MILSSIQLALLPVLAQAMDTGLTDKLLAHLLNQNLAEILMKAVDIPWNAGTYGITISKSGDALLDSDQAKVRVKIPLQTAIIGKVDQDLGFTRVVLNCKSRFDHIGTLLIEPVFSPQGVKFKSSLDLPIPPTQANCDGVVLPLTAVLQQLVKNNKLQWEAKIDEVFNKQFNAQRPPPSSQ